MPVDPITAGSLLGPEAQIDGVGSIGAEGQIGAPAPAEEGFGAALADQIGALEGIQQAADAQQTALATGQANDINAVVVAAERAQLSMQLATQVRNKVVDAYHELFRTQV